MKRVIFAALALVAIACSQSPTEPTNKNVERFAYDKFNIHLYTSDEAMGDVSIVVEGAESVVILEPQSFYKSIEDLNNYIAELGKPIEKVVANYHAGGLATYAPETIVMVEPMVDFMKSDMAQGMMAKFSKVFDGAMDTRSVEVEQTIPVQSTQEWAGVEFDFSTGAVSDFPASVVNVGGKLFYTHFAPMKNHPAPMQVGSMEAIEATLAELKKARESGCEIFVGSHGAVSSMADVEFRIEYLEQLKTLRAKCENSDIFAQQLILAYPALDGAEKIRAIAKGLYPNQRQSAEVEVIKGRVQDYFDMVSNLDTTIAKGLWADREDVSIITPRGHFVGYNAIMNDFLIKNFSSMTYRKLSSISEVVNIYGDSANVQLYWIFDTKDANGVANQTRGRESLIFSKIDGEWRLVHVHYSRMPQ